MTKDESDLRHARLRLSGSKTYENGALAQEALDEMVEEMKEKLCPLSINKRNAICCEGDGCAIFNNGDIAIIPDHHYTISIKPHCGLIK